MFVPWLSERHRPAGEPKATGRPESMVLVPSFLLSRRASRCWIRHPAKTRPSVPTCRQPESTISCAASRQDGLLPAATVEMQQAPIPEGKGSASVDPKLEVATVAAPAVTVLINLRRVTYAKNRPPERELERRMVRCPADLTEHLTISGGLRSCLEEQLSGKLEDARIVLRSSDVAGGEITEHAQVGARYA